MRKDNTMKLPEILKKIGASGSENRQSDTDKLCLISELRNIL